MSVYVMDRFQSTNAILGSCIRVHLLYATSTDLLSNDVMSCTCIAISSKRAARKDKALRVNKQKLKKAETRCKKLEAQRVRDRQNIYRRNRRIDTLLVENKGFKKELKELRSSQALGIKRQRKGKGPRAHLTMDPKALTMQAIDATGMATERWQRLCSVIGGNLFSGEQGVDLKGCSDTTVRRLLETDDMICLLHEAEELQQQGLIKNLQFMCDISPLLGREYNQPHPSCM